MANVTDPATISVNGPTTAAPLQSILSYLRNLKKVVVAGNVPTPAGGQIGAGDANWIVVGSGGNIPGTNPPIPVPGYLNGWSAFIVNGTVGARFRKYPDGTVEIQGNVQGGTTTVDTPIFLLPVGWRPGVRLSFTTGSGPDTFQTWEIGTGSANGNVGFRSGTNTNLALVARYMAEQ